jgi:serine beta-lactamase-like protein LACTB
VLEGASKEKSFTNLLTDLLKELDMKETCLDCNDTIVLNRSKFYMRNDKKRLVNVPCVDNSYKWAGGGLLSTVNDLLKFGNKMLLFYQDKSGGNFLKSETVKNLLWTAQSKPENVKSKDREFLCEPSDTVSYGLGWFVCFDKENTLKYAYHTGGAMGATSCIMIIPDRNEVDSSLLSNKRAEPRSGTVVVVLCNSHDASEIVKFTHRVAEFFK